MPHLIHRESHGDGTAIGPQTQWGTAKGSTQLLDDTAKGVARKIGLPYRQDLLHSNTPEALAYQQQLGAAYLQEGYQKTGNAFDAFRYYHGGPNRSLWGHKTNAYAEDLIGRLGSN